MKESVDLRELAIDRGDTAPTKVRLRTNVLTRYVIPLMLVCGFLSLVGWASRDIVFPPQPVTVMPVYSTTAKIQQAGTPLFQAAGWIEPRPTPVRVAALAQGVVETLHVVENDPIKTGEPVAELVKDDARLSLERAQAELALRQAEVQEAEATLQAAKTRFEQPVHLQAALGEASANLAKIETQLKNLPFEVRRADSEFEAARQDYEGKSAASDVVAGIQIDIARSKMDSTKAMVEELEDREVSLQKEQAALLQRRDALKTQLHLLADETKARDEANAKLQAAKARVTQAEVAVAEAKLQLDRMTIRAPIDGRVYRLIAHPGARIGSGMTQMLGHDGSTVVTMYDPESLQVRVDVRFEDIPKVQLEQPVEIDNPTLESSILGSVLFISSEADIQKNTLEVKVGIPEPPTVFKPEMLVDVTFLAPDRLDHSKSSTQEIRLFILNRLVQRSENGTFVWVVDQSEGIAKRVQIETGETGNNGLVEVISGLNAASRLVTSGTEQLEVGDHVRITHQETITDQNRNASNPN